MFIAVIALVVGLVVGLPNSITPQLADNTNGTSTDYNFFFFLYVQTSDEIATKSSWRMGYISSPTKSLQVEIDKLEFLVVRK